MLDTEINKQCMPDTKYQLCVCRSVRRSMLPPTETDPETGMRPYFVQQDVNDMSQVPEAGVEPQCSSGPVDYETTGSVEGGEWSCVGKSLRD